MNEIKKEIIRLLFVHQKGLRAKDLARMLTFYANKDVKTDTKEYKILCNQLLLLRKNGLIQTFRYDHYDPRYTKDGNIYHKLKDHVKKEKTMKYLKKVGVFQ